MEEQLEKLKFPIGEFIKPDLINHNQISSWIEDIEGFPTKVNLLTDHLTVEQLNWRYRPEGWTIKQVVHHCADSHMNSLIRFKLALTENTPTIRPYNEARWANLIDGNEDHLQDTLWLLKGLHAKLGTLLRNLMPEDLTKEYVHPEHGKHFSLGETIGMYAWHCNHHLAHIKQALDYKGEF